MVQPVPVLQSVRTSSVRKEEEDGCQDSDIVVDPEEDKMVRFGSSC